MVEHQCHFGVQRVLVLKGELLAERNDLGAIVVRILRSSARCDADLCDPGHGEDHARDGRVGNRGGVTQNSTGNVVGFKGGRWGQLWLYFIDDVATGVDVRYSRLQVVVNGNAAARSSMPNCSRPRFSTLATRPVAPST